MSSSLVREIWAAAFQAPPLVIATHVSFALLQTTSLVLVLLFFNTPRSWSLVFLCGGLWAGITWFMREAAQIRRLEREADRLRKLRVERDREADAREAVWFVPRGGQLQLRGGVGETEGKKVQ